MTAHKHLKQRIRARMEKTGESYATARRQIIRSSDQEQAAAAQSHFPGNVPATTALRSLLAHAGVVAPHTRAPFSEAMLFGIAGGIGLGVFSFYYQKEDVATFFLAGRHKWHDDAAYLSGALDLFGIQPAIQETSGAKAAAQQLRDTLDRYGSCIAWVDMAELPNRAMPGAWSGGSYHVVTIYSVNDASGTAEIGDLTDEPISVALADLARARARIKKQRHRLLAIPQEAGDVPDLAKLVRSGLQRCHHELLHPSLPGSQSNARLDALRIWAERMGGAKDKDRWEQVFRPGPNLWRGLCAIYDFIEHYGTGGGLCRPLFADFLAEAAEALHNPALAALGERYAQLGREWSALANAALPDNVPALREAKELHMRKAELANAGGLAEDVRAIWGPLQALEQQHHDPFPLSDADYAALRARLRERILALYEGEVAAHAAIGDALTAGA